MDAASLVELLVADLPAAWAAAGFKVDPDGGCQIGSVRVRLVGREHGMGIIGWSLLGLPQGWGGDIDGIPTDVAGPDSQQRAVHPNGVISIDHVVLLSPDLNRTVLALAAIGATPRRERDGVLGGQKIRQIFFRLGEVIVELIGSLNTSAEGPSTLWGITYVVKDIDATASYFGSATSEVKDAVQPGRRITTLRHREFDLSVRTALISPHVRA